MLHERNAQRSSVAVLALAHTMPAADAEHEPFDGLFLREYPRVVEVAARILLDRHAAEDVAQDVFVAFSRKHDPNAQFAQAWLYRAAVHSAFNVLRGARRRSIRERLNALLGRPLQHSQGREADPLQATLRNEERNAVRAVLARLPERTRAVLALRHGGLSYAETAAALGVKINQVGTLLARAETAFTKEITSASPL